MNKYIYIIAFTLLGVYEIVSLARVAFGAVIGVEGNFIPFFEKHFISEFSLLLFAVISIIYISRAPKKNLSSSLTKSFLNFNIYLIVVSSLFSLLHPFSTVSTYISLLIPLLVFHFFVYISPQVGERTVAISLLVLFAFLVYAYYVTFNTRLFEKLTNDDFSVSNASYFAVYLLPFILCIKDNKAKVVTILIATIVCLTSFKRGSTVCLAVGILVYLMELNQTSSKKKISFRSLLFAGIIIAGVYYITNYVANSSGGFLSQRFESIAEDKGTHRLDIYRTTLSMIFTSYPFYFLFGHGWDMVVVNSPLKFSAHNDFLEIFYDLGVVGFYLLIHMLVRIWKWFKILHKKKSRYAPPLAASLAILVFGMMFSHIFLYPYYFLLFSATWGYIYSITKENRIIT